MGRRSLLLATAVLGFAACDPGPTEPSAVEADYAMALFGDAGAALEDGMGPQGPHAFDGRSHGLRRLPAELALTEAQKASIEALRTAFRTQNAAALAELRASLEAARDARRDGKTREEVRAIREQARPIAESLKPAVEALHAAVKAVLTDAQRAWLEEHRPERPRR